MHPLSLTLTFALNHLANKLLQTKSPLVQSNVQLMINIQQDVHEL